MNKPTLYIMAGCQGCGKSYYAALIKKYHPATVLVSRDKIRFNILKDGEDYFAHENEVTQKYYNAIVTALNMGKDVIADATHLTRKARKQLRYNLDIRNVCEYRSVVVWVEAPLQVALERNAAREGRARVPEDVIRNAYTRKVSPDTEQFDEVVFITSNEDMAITTSNPEIRKVSDVLKSI